MGQSSSTEVDAGMGSPNKKRARTQSRDGVDGVDGVEGVDKIYRISGSGQRIPRRKSTNHGNESMISAAHDSNHHLKNSNDSNKLKDFNSLPWKCIPPKEGEPHRKIKNDTEYFWCAKCKKNKGFWTNHKTEQHIHNFQHHMHHAPQSQSRSNANGHHQTMNPLPSQRSHSRESQSNHGENRRNINGSTAYSNDHQRLLHNQQVSAPRLGINGTTHQKTNIQKNSITPSQSQHPNRNIYQWRNSSVRNNSGNVRTKNNRNENNPPKRLGKSARAMLGNKRKNPTPSDLLKQMKDTPKAPINYSSNINRARSISSSTQISSSKKLPSSTRRASSCPNITTESLEVSHKNFVSGKEEDATACHKTNELSKSRLRCVGNERSISVSNNIEINKSTVSNEKDNDSNVIAPEMKSKKDDIQTVIKKIGEFNNREEEKDHSSEQADKREEEKDNNSEQTDNDMDISDDTSNESRSASHEKSKVSSSKQAIALSSGDKKSDGESDFEDNHGGSDENNFVSDRDKMETSITQEIIVLSSDEENSTASSESEEQAIDRSSPHTNDTQHNKSEQNENNDLILDKVQQNICMKKSFHGKQTTKKRMISCKLAGSTALNQRRVISHKKASTLKKGKVAIAIGSNEDLKSSTSLSDSDDSNSSNYSSIVSEELQKHDSKDDSGSSGPEKATSKSFSLRRKLGRRIDRQKPSREESHLDEEERKFLEAKLERTSIDFLKSLNLLSIQKLMSSSTLKLAADYKSWRQESEDCYTLQNTVAQVARWQDIASKFDVQKKKDPTSTPSSTMKQMQLVPHLTRTEMGGGQLPIHYITVMQGEDEDGKRQHMETLLDFKINIRRSRIPNSGHGAFLTFLGARKLKEEAKKKTQFFLKDRVYVHTETTKPLLCKIGHHNASVTLKGHNIHGNGNSGYFHKTRFPLRAVSPGTSPPVEYRVILCPHSIHEDIQNLRDRNEIPNPKNGLGFLEMFDDRDYEPDNEVKFSSDDFGLVDIGRYGPFLKSDRKTQVEFNLKDFIFDFEPAGWNFGVEERFKGCNHQVIDITDDCTGEPHRVAEQHVPMYVNEVGHDNNLEQNVIAREQDDRVVHYYVRQCKPMSKGDTVELLVHYGDAYEGTRLRKGYGKKNIEQGLECDKDDGSKFKRDHADRASIKIMIQSMPLNEIEHALEFLEVQIMEPLVVYTDNYFTGIINQARNARDVGILSQMRQPTHRQLRARQRLSFIGNLFRKRLDTLVNENTMTKEISSMYKCVEEIRLNPFVQFESDLLQREDDLWNIYLSEKYAEITLQISSGYGLFHSYEPSLWCFVARDLCMNLARLVSKTLIQQRNNSLSQLKQMYEMAEDAAGLIRNACNSLSSTRSSPQTILESCRLLGFIQSENKIINTHLKSIGLSHEQDYRIVELIPTGHYAGSAKYPVIGLPSALEVFCSSVSPKQEKNHNKKQLLLRCLAKEACREVTFSPQLVHNGHFKIDYQWYLLWQIVRVVDVFEKHFPQNGYCLKTLCEKVKVDHISAESVTSVEMKEPFEAMYTHYDENIDAYDNESVSGDDIKPTRFFKTLNKLDIPRREKKRFKRTTSWLYDETDGSLPEGWRLEKVARQTGKHVDRYWYSQTGKKMRSRVEVEMFLRLIKSYNGDEEAAWSAFPGSRKTESKRKSKN